MPFRQNLKVKRNQNDLFEAWKQSNQALFEKAALPTCVTQSRDDWAYFVEYQYHDRGNWTTPPFTEIDFQISELSEEQRTAFFALEAIWREHIKTRPDLAKFKRAMH